MATILDGKSLSIKIKSEISEITAKNEACGFRRPCLAVVLAGDDPASQIYVKNKIKSCAETGITSKQFVFSADTTESELLELISTLNNDSEVDGILVQSPLPKHINEQKITESISVSKDVDAFHPENVGKIMLGLDGFAPCTPSGIIRLLDEYNIEIAGKHCVVIGRSNIVGKPMALLLLQRNGTVTICHSKTKNLSDYTKTADILVVAVGKAGIVNGDMIKEGAVIVDVGMNRIDKKLFGDVDFESCAAKASFITPVPGGVGPMTIAMLLKNTTYSYKKTLGI
ncbi:MAG: bifunctional methylenetetrahydrofolate dehydrogenase/methenyltetrahydrofolate cyclohydrolase FolD [Clostridia bacterium]